MSRKLMELELIGSVDQHRFTAIKLRLPPLKKGKTPSFPILSRIGQERDCESVIAVFNDWMSQYLKAERIAIDGKSINNTVSASQESEPNFVSLVTFFSQPSHLITQNGKIRK